MRTALFEARYYETYYFANIIKNILSDPFPYIHKLDAFYGDDAYVSFIQPFPKFSVFHQFIAFIIHDSLYEVSTDVDLEDARNREKRYGRFAPDFYNFRQLPINDALAHHQIEHESFEEYLGDKSKSFENADEDDVFDYFQEYLWLTGIIDSLVEKMTEEVFFVMFHNRTSLRDFNIMIAQFVISEILIDGLPPEEKALFKRDGVLARKRIPVWARNAVFFRDRGRCALCHRDISGLVSIDSEEHFDHIVPLAKGGMNDVTNIQLLCRECNLQKSAGSSATSFKYERWY